MTMLDAQSCLALFEPAAKFAGWMLACAIFLVHRYRRKAPLTPALLTAAVLFVIASTALIDPLDKCVGPGVLLSAARMGGSIIFVAFYLAIPLLIPGATIAALIYLAIRWRAKRGLAQPMFSRKHAGLRIWVLWLVCIAWSAAVAAIAAVADHYVRTEITHASAASMGSASAAAPDATYAYNNTPRKNACATVK